MWDFLTEKSQYQRLVGNLIYLYQTRPNIASVVSVGSQFMHDPQKIHLSALNKILQYLKASTGKGLLFKRECTLSMEVYIDADYAGQLLIEDPPQSTTCLWEEIW